MKVNEFLKELPNLCQDRKIFTQVGAVVICTLIFLFGLSQLYQSYQKAQENTQKISNMKVVIDKYKKLNEKMSAEEYRPIDVKELDSVQTNILSNIQKYNLTLSDFSNKAEKKADNYQRYTLTVQGEWQKIAKFLEDFNSGESLISINKTDFKQVRNSVNTDDDSSLVECEITYKVYTK